MLKHVSDYAPIHSVILRLRNQISDEAVAISHILRRSGARRGNGS